MYIFTCNGSRRDAHLLRSPFLLQPEGGVTEGQTFLAELPDDFTGDRLNIPTGHWKDGLFECCNDGVSSPSLWCAICCPQSKCFSIRVSSVLLCYPTHIVLEC